MLLPLALSHITGISLPLKPTPEQVSVTFAFPPPNSLTIDEQRGNVHVEGSLIGKDTNQSPNGTFLTIDFTATSTTAALAAGPNNVNMHIPLSHSGNVLVVAYPQNQHTEQYCTVQIRMLVKHMEEATASWSNKTLTNQVAKCQGKASFSASHGGGVFLSGEANAAPEPHVSTKRNPASGTFADVTNKALATQVLERQSNGTYSGIWHWDGPILQHDGDAAVPSTGRASASISVTTKYYYAVIGYSVTNFRNNP